MRLDFTRDLLHNSDKTFYIGPLQTFSVRFANAKAITSLGQSRRKNPPYPRPGGPRVAQGPHVTYGKKIFL